MTVVKFYTRASRVRIMIAKFDGRWTIPGGPYPIPELATLVTGLLTTLYLVGHLGHPMIAGMGGAGVTAGAVMWMRKMPYSPVPIGTRIYRMARLLISPVSHSANPPTGTTRSMVVPRLDIFESPAPPTTAGRNLGAETPPLPLNRLFDHQPSPAAGLFG